MPFLKTGVIKSKEVIIVTEPLDEIPRRRANRGGKGGG